MKTAPLHSRFDVIGVPVSVVNLPVAVDTVVKWAAEKQTYRTVFVRDVASLMATVKSPELLLLHHEASLIVPDGMPLVVAGKMKGLGRRVGRVAGADLVDAVCKASLATGQSHYFFGGKEGVAEKMAESLSKKYPELQIAGTFCPPMREIGPKFAFSDLEQRAINDIRELQPSFVWIGLSSPKQEFWMMKAAPLIGSGVFLGVGAAFDFHSGEIKRAPLWMQKSGLEWLHRLGSEPRRLWHRYLVLAPQFLYRFILSKKVPQERPAF